MATAKANPKPVVALLNAQRGWGGGEKWHFETARFLKEAGYQVCVIGANQSILTKKSQAQNIPCHFLSVSNLSFLNPYKVIRLALYLRRVDIVIVNSPADNKLAGMASLLSKTTRTVFRRGMPHPISPSWVNRWLFSSRIDRVIANSKAVAASLNARQSDLVAPEKITVIYNGTDFEEYDRRSTAETFVLDSEEKLFTLVNCGRLVEQKNQQLLIDAACFLKQHGFAFRLLIAGEGPLRDTLQTKIQQYGLQAQCQLVGFVENVKDVLSVADVFLLPSLYEGSSNALIEACGAGLPVVVSDIPSNSEIVADGVSGYILPTDNAELWAEKIGELINNQDRCRRMGAASALEARETFSVNKTRQSLEALLESLRA